MNSCNASPSGLHVKDHRQGFPLHRVVLGTRRAVLMSWTIRGNTSDQSSHFGVWLSLARMSWRCRFMSAMLWTSCSACPCHTTYNE